MLDLANIFNRVKPKQSLEYTPTNLYSNLGIANSIFGNPDDPPKSKYKPTIGHKEGNEYITDKNVYDKFKKIVLAEERVKKTGKSYIEDILGNDFIGDVGAPLEFAKTGKWKISKSKDERGQYYSLFNYNPLGKSFYDRIYVNDLDNIDYDEKEANELFRHLSTGAIRPYKDGYEYGDKSMLDNLDNVGIASESKKFIFDWFNSAGARQRYIQSGGNKDDWEKTKLQINDNLKTLKIKKRPSLGDLYVSGSGEYQPSSHTVINNSRYENTYTHEITHGTRIDEIDEHSRSIINNIVNKYKTTESLDDYYHSEEEVYARIMYIRDMLGIKSNEKITTDSLKKKFEDIMFYPKYVDPIFKYIKMDGIVELLNKLAVSGENKNNNNQKC